MPSPGFRGSLGWDAVTSFFRGQAFSEARRIVHLRLHLNSAMDSLHHLYGAHLLIQQIFTLCQVLCFQIFPSAHRRTGPKSFLGWINYPTSLRVYLSSVAKYMQFPRSPASSFQTRSLPRMLLLHFGGHTLGSRAHHSLDNHTSSCPLPPLFPAGSHCPSNIRLLYLIDLITPWDALTGNALSLSLFRQILKSYLSYMIDPIIN